MRAGFTPLHHHHHHHHQQQQQQRLWWNYLFLCLAAIAVLYTALGTFYSFTIPSHRPPHSVEEVARCPLPSSKLPKGERYMLYSPHSGFSNQVGELKNALLVSALLGRTLVLPPVFDHHAVVLGSCPKFRVNEASEMRSMAWNHISELIRHGRYVAIADIIDVSKLQPFFKTIDLRVFSSLWCGVDVSSACSGPLCRRIVAYGLSSGTLESCGSLLSKPEESHGGCVYPVDDDCRTTVWVHGDISNKSQLSGKLQWSTSGSANEGLNGTVKRKKQYQRVFKDIIDALGDGSEASKFPVLSFGSLFSAEYKGTQLYLDLHSSQDPKIRTLVEATTFLSFTPPIVNAGKWYSKAKIGRPFFCAQLRLLDGQFKNHWTKTFSSLKSQLKLAHEQRGSGSEVLPLFVMTDLPRSNWSNTYLGELDMQTSTYEVHILEEGNGLIQKTVKELAKHDYGIRSGFLPHDEGIVAEEQKHSNEWAVAPDILLYIEEVICSCATLGFSGTSGSTLTENILLLREANTCDG